MRKLWPLFLILGLFASAVGLFLAAPSMIDLARLTIATDGGTRLRLQVDPALDAIAVQAAAKADAEVVQWRLQAMGWDGAKVRTDGSRRLLVDVAGVFDGDSVARVATARGVLMFRLVAPNPPANGTRLSSLDGTEPPLAVLPGDMLGGGRIVDASASVDAQTNAVVVKFRFNSGGEKGFAEATARNVGARMAVVLDDKILTAPRIVGPIPEGAGQIGGGFTPAQAREIAALMRAGPLPAPLTLVASEQVKPPGK